jgi:diacylglycerol kinase (ATP)
MTDESLALFLNPTAGRGRAGRRLPRIIELLEGSGIAVVLCSSRSAGDLEQQVCDQVSAGARKILVAGGDGSVHEAVNGIMRADSTAALGVIPTGTGNDFAKASSIPLDWEHATQLLANRLAADSKPRKIDLGRMNDRYFANGAGIGFDAKVTRIAHSIRLPIGDLVYLLAIFRCMVDGITTPDVQISADDEIWNGPLTLANVSNGPWVGGMFHIAPMADNSDGQLDLVIAGPVSRTRILRLLPKLMRGRHMTEADITYANVQRLTIETSEPMPSHLDGEVQELGTSFDIEIQAEALDLL